MELRLHDGLHGPETRRLVRRALAGEHCLVPVPPRIQETGWTMRLDSVEGAAFGLFTSGTTGGQPRIVFLSRRNVEASVGAILSLFDEKRLDSVFVYPQPSHVFGLVLGYVLAELRGLDLFAAPGKYGAEAHRLRASLDRPGLLTLGTPTHFRDLEEYSVAPSYAAIVGGAPVTVAQWRRMRDRLRIEVPSIGYGATEASPGVTHLPPGIEPREDGEIGFALPGVKLRITDAGVAFTGDNVALAVADERGTRRLAEGFLNDRIVARPDGRLVFAGRCDAVLNRGGEKFPLDALERRLPVEAICVALPDERLGEELGVVTREPVDLARLGVPFARARHLVVKRLPVGENGKPSRAAAAALFARYPIPTRTLAGVPHRAPMVWIDEVTGEQECAVVYRATAAYAGPDGLRPSSLVELMAQSYAFIRAAHGEVASRGYLAAMSDVTIDAGPIAEGERLTVRAKKIRELGALTLVEAEVHGGDGATIARGRLKLYAESASLPGSFAQENQ